MTLENILLDLNDNCKISNLFYFGGTKFNEFVRYDLPKLGYLMYQMLTGKIFNFDLYKLVFYKNSLPENNKYANNLLNELLSCSVSNEFIEFYKQMTLEENEFSTSEISIKATLNLKSHLLFNDINWTKLENGKIQAPLELDKVYLFIVFFKILILNLVVNQHSRIVIE